MAEGNAECGKMAMWCQ